MENVSEKRFDYIWRNSFDTNFAMYGETPFFDTTTPIFFFFSFLQMGQPHEKTWVECVRLQATGFLSLLGN